MSLIYVILIRTPKKRLRAAKVRLVARNGTHVVVGAGVLPMHKRGLNSEGPYLIKA